MNHENIANYAEDNTHYVPGKNIDERVGPVIFKWFSDNKFQENASKCHVLLSFDRHVQVNIGAAKTKNNSS